MGKYFCYAKRLLGLTLLICGGVFLLSESVFAQWDMLTRELLKEGRRYYDAGHYEEAIHEFSKVLLSDPRNPEALSCLKEMGLDGGLYGQRNNPQDQVYRLTQQVKAYRDGMENLQTQNEQQRQLRQVVNDQVRKNQEMAVSRAELRAVATMKLLEQQDDLRRFQKQGQTQAQDVIRLSSDLAQAANDLDVLEQRIRDQDDLIARQRNRVTLLEDDYHRSQAVGEEERSALKAVYTKKLALLEGERNALDQQLLTSRQDYQEKIRQYQQELTTAETELKMQQRLSEARAAQLARQEQRYSALQEEREKLRAEREQFIDEAQEIRQKIQGYQDALRQTRFKSQQAAVYLEYIRQQNQEIAVLKEQAARILNELSWLKMRAPETSRGQADELKKRVSELEQEIQEKEQSLELSKEQHEMLSDRIEEYKERLKTVEEMILDKEQRILLLEEQLNAESAVNENHVL